MPRVASRTYDPQTGTWTANTVDDDSPAPAPSSQSQPAKNTDVGGGGESNLKASSTDKDDSAGKTDKEYNVIEYNTLEGDLVFIVTEETIKLKPGDTIKLNGLGKYLSGNYYIVSIDRSISTDGYSHSAVVIRTDFGDKLKSSSSTETKDGGSTPPKETQTTPSTSAADTTPQRTYTVKKGDCLWNIAKQYYGSGAQYTKLVDANTSTQANPNLIFPGQVLIIP